MRYPTEAEEFVIVERVTGTVPEAVPVIDTNEMRQLQRECRKVYVEPSLMQYAVRLTTATRAPDEHLTYGVSPRASIHLVEGARALAFLRGRDYALPEDVVDLAPDVLRHRLVLSYEALAEGIIADQLVNKLLQKVRVPPRPLQSQSHARVAVAAGS